MIGTAEFHEISHVKKCAFLDAFFLLWEFEQGC
jgi:hypothetical protein